VNLEQMRARQWIYRPGTVRDHVEQAIHDLRSSRGYCLGTNQDEKIQGLKIYSETLEPIAIEAEKELTRLADQLDL